MTIDIKPFTELIKNRTGLSIEKLCKEFIIEKIIELMHDRHIDSDNEYLQVLVNDQDEYLKFLNFLTVNETYFFREPEYIKIFSQNLIPELIKQINKIRKIRILSAGCSTGEEPYSLAVELMEKFGTDYYHFFSISGIDIDNDAIIKAKKGIYRETSFRNTDSYFKNTYFEKIDNKEYKIKDCIKNNVNFINYNLLNVPYPDYLRNMDIIFYRNVSIYFEDDTQKKIMIKLSDILNPKGYLIVSSTETLSHSFNNILSLIKINDFFLFYKEEEISYKKSLINQALSLVKKDKEYNQDINAESDVNSITWKHDQTEIKNTGELFNQALSYAKRKEYNRALSILEKIETDAPYFEQGQMLTAGILINLNEIEQAKEICLSRIKSDSLCIESYLLLGIIARMENNFQQAIKRFREVLYINSSTWLAHFYMAEIYQKENNFGLAVQKYNNVINLLQQNNFDNHGLSFFPFSFSEENIMHLCRYNKKKLEHLL